MQMLSSGLIKMQLNLKLFFELIQRVEKSMTNLLADTEWKVGDRCYSMFSEDELWYPATIKKV